MRKLVTLPGSEWQPGYYEAHLHSQTFFVAPHFAPADSDTIVLFC